LNRAVIAADVGGLFFPQRIPMGLDSRHLTPELGRVIIHLTAEVRSFERVEQVLDNVLGQQVDSCTIRRCAAQIGLELGEHQHSESETAQNKEVIVPELAVVSCDGGRILTREPGHGPGVFNPQWRETKNAAFERMMVKEVCNEDPCPELPSTFVHPEEIVKIAESTPLEISSDVPFAAEAKNFYQGPERIMRTCVSSMIRSDDFGETMAREAKRRRFFESPRCAFLGDGLPWNWTIWREHFPDFEPILDFIHPIFICIFSSQDNHQYGYRRLEILRAMDRTLLARRCRYRHLRAAREPERPRHPNRRNS
jgi:hypothetical protein